MIGVVDQGHIGALVLLDLSAAFDTVDHSILMDVLRRRFGIDGSALRWVAEFLSNRRQVVYAGKTESDNIALQFGVPQGSVLGPRVFVQYAEDVDDIFRRHRVHHHLFADDMQGYCSGRLNDVSTIVSRLENCIYAWCGAKRLQLNADKTELLWFCPGSQLRVMAAIKLPSENSTIHVNQCVVKPVTVVRDPGMLPLSCYRKKLHNLSHFNFGL